MRGWRCAAMCLSLVAFGCEDQNNTVFPPDLTEVSDLATTHDLAKAGPVADLAVPADLSAMLVDAAMAPDLTPPPDFSVANNLVTNGSFESGITGWTGFCSATAGVSTAFAHSGTSSGVASNRTQTCGAISYALPTGPGVYAISAWALQDGGTTLPVRISVKAVCSGVTSYSTVASGNAPTITWIDLMGNLTLPAGCTSATLYLEQASGSVFPNLYIDDVTVVDITPPSDMTVVADMTIPLDFSTPLDFSEPADMAIPSINLAHNAGAEVGASGATPTGWASFCATPKVSTTIFHTGTQSAGVTARTTGGCNGPAFPFPRGAATYTVSAWTYQTGTGLAQNVSITVKNTVTGTDHYTNVKTVSVPTDTWTQISGTITLPAGCTAATLYLETPTVASGAPDLYMDDLFIGVPYGTDVVGNGDTEQGTPGWALNAGGTLTSVTSQFHAGAKSLSLTGRANNYDGPLYAMPAAVAKYTVTAYAYQATGAALSMNLAGKTTCGGVDGFPSIQFGASVPDSTWTKLTGTLTLPANCTSAAVYVEQTSGTVHPDIFVDDLSAVLTP